MTEPIRINKRLAELRIASRREADTLIAERKVLVNGEVAVIGQKVSATDTIEIVGKTKKKQYLVYYKPRGIITHSPAADEVDIATKLKEDYDITDVAPIGRLDKDSEGLIILTNDGRITGPLLDPEANHEKEYLVSVDKPVTSWLIRHLEAGVDIEGYQTKPAKAKVHQKNKHVFYLTITEGKKHQIRRMCAALGFQVTDLKRLRIMDLTLGKLKPNQFRKLSTPEIKKLLGDLGVTTA